MQNVEKAKQAGERLLNNMKRAGQLSLMNMVEEQKTNAKLLEKDQTALKVLGCCSSLSCPKAQRANGIYRPRRHGNYRQRRACGI